MDLIFDRGTLLLKNVERLFNVTKCPGLTWDERVAHYRAPATKYWSVLKSLKSVEPELHDSVSQIHKLKGEWKPETISLRPYQEAALQAWSVAENRGLVVLPTGSGKTRVAMAAIAKTGQATLCLVPTRVLLEQWHGWLRAAYSGDIGIYGDGTHDIGEITIATYESAYRHMDVLGNRFGLLVVDEAHHFGCGIRDEIFDMTIAPYRLGLTGTLPRYSDQLSKLTTAIGAPVYELSISDLRGCFLADFDLYSLQLDLSPEERAIYDLNIGFFSSYYGRFRRACPEASWLDFIRIASQCADGRRAIKGLQIAKKVTNFCKSKAATVASLLKQYRSQQVLIFTADADTAYLIAREHLVMPITAEIGRKERESVIENFKRGRLKALVSCRVLNEGFDVPSAEVAIVVGGTHGEREHLQRIGRILRPSEGKKAAVYELICRGTQEVRQSTKRNMTIAPRKITSLFDSGSQASPALSW